MTTFSHARPLLAQALAEGLGVVAVRPPRPRRPRRLLRLTAALGLSLMASGCCVAGCWV